MREYTVIFEEGPRSWGAYAPDLPGCVAAASTRAEVELLIREAMQAYIDYLREDGQPVPEPRMSAQPIAIAA